MTKYCPAPNSRMGMGLGVGSENPEVKEHKDDALVSDVRYGLHPHLISPLFSEEEYGDEEGGIVRGSRARKKCKKSKERKLNMVKKKSVKARSSQIELLNPAVV